MFASECYSTFDPYRVPNVQYSKEMTAIDSALVAIFLVSVAKRIERFSVHRLWVQISIFDPYRDFFSRVSFFYVWVRFLWENESGRPKGASRACWCRMYKPTTDWAGSRLNALWPSLRAAKMWKFDLRGICVHHENPQRELAQLRITVSSYQCIISYYRGRLWHGGLVPAGIEL